MQDLIRASALQGFDVVVRDLGGDPDALLAEAGIATDLIGDVDAYLPYRALARIVERASVVLACPDFGLRLSRRQGIEILGAVALIARHAPTAADALDDLRRHLHFYSSAFEVAVAPRTATEARYTFTILVPRLRERAQVLELSLGVSLGLFRLLLGDRFRPARAFLPHAAVGEPAAYDAFFGCPVAFGAEACGFDLPSADLGRRRTGDDAVVRDLVTRYLDVASAPADAALADQVRGLVGRAMPTGQARVETIAAHMGVHVRTLQRGLRAEGTTYERVLDDVRRERAEQDLRHTTRPMGEVASRLGYSEQSCLSRASRRWFGAPPRAVRARGPAAG